ncbi:hypothetical protein BD408DRAFT_447550 [Parasitella parasitica]|nr:hypothetical protein BD408DRAFT_447550 [Parasitella parasitica]
MTREGETDALFSLPLFANRPGTDLMNKHILQNDEVKSAIIEAVIGRKAIDQYRPRLTEWANGTKSDVLYATNNSKDMPPVLVEIQYAVDNNFLHRVVRYCEEIVTEYGVSPVVLVVAIHECSSQIMNKATKNKSKPFFFKMPCYPWANQCYILCKESISSHMENTPLDPIVALGSFFIEQRQSLADHAHHRDPFIQHLYSNAKHIFQNQITMNESVAGCLLRVIEDAESRYHKAIDMLDDDVQDTNTKKRTIDYLKEGMTFLRTCKRKFVSSGSSSPIPLSTTSSAHESRSPSPTNSIPETSSHLRTIPSEQPSSINDSATAEESSKNWRYIEDYMEQIGDDRMNWQTCYRDGRRKGYFKNYSTHFSLKNTYNRWKKMDNKRSV